MEENQEEVQAPVAVEAVSEEIASTATLRSLINDLHITLDEARNVIVKYQQRSIGLDERESNVLNREVSVDSRSKDLKAREAACEKVENIQSTAITAQKLMDQANLRSNEATEAERRLKTSTEEQASLMREERLQTQKEANALETQRKQLDEEVSKRVAKVLLDMGIKQPA